MSEEPAQPPTFQQDAARYAAMVQAALSASMPALAAVQFAAEAARARVVQVERGILFPHLLTAREPGSQGLAGIAAPLLAALREGYDVIDGRGHTRAVYGPLLVYAAAHACRLGIDGPLADHAGRWEQTLRASAERLAARVADFAWPAEALPAASGTAVSALCWEALALLAASKVFVRAAWVDLASDTFGRLKARQQPDGAFLAASASDNPEAHWYDELVILHAAASYAVQAEDRSLARHVARNAMFHLEQTQPDHATQQPWALFAFIWDSRARPLADAVLHAYAIHQQPSGARQVCR